MLTSSHPLKPPFSLHNVLIFALNIFRLDKPALQVSEVDVPEDCITLPGGLEFSFGHQTGLVKGLTAPEKQTDAVILFVVTGYRAAI